MALAKLFLIVLGLLYIATGLWCAIKPRETMEAVGLTTTNGSGLSEYFTVYGGFLVGVGAFFAIAGGSTAYWEAGLLAVLVSHGGLIAFRALSLILFSNIKSLTYGLAAFELVVFIASALLFWLATKRA